MAIFNHRAVWQACVLALIGIVLISVGIEFDAAEAIGDWIRRHEAHEVDEVMFALDIVGILSIIYGALRIFDLKQERKRREQAERRADWMAVHDSLTGLHNRHSLEEKLNQMGKRHGGRFAMLIIDLDGFKRINDLVGHQAGDAVLQAVADRLREHVAADSVFRLGGDEFVVFVDRIAAAPQLARTLLQALNRPVIFRDTSLDVGASIGMASCPDNAADARECLRCADAAMYVAKSTGRGSLRAFDNSMREQMLLRDRDERDLRAAIRAGRIKPYYQPIIDLSDNRICGFEALARWEREDGVLVSPGDFIPLAEETGLILDLTESLLATACRDAMTWPSDILLSFNISPIQLQDQLLGMRILRILSTAGLPPSRLEIEITETALIQDVRTAAAILSDLRTAGISIALDDFGTGYSSLAHLSNLSFDKIKIDRSFVSSFQDQERQEKIVKAIVGLGIGLDVPTTAEGIETANQLASLTGMGCTYGQGYLFGRAMPAAEAARMLSTPRGQEASA
ncbi:EAL domain-containing protein [Rhizobium sp. CSW-27]|uniref:putative bifunctional diguanylate cyclase/phosphodiesterase n=1 Tax=Rhizobium sp. CSW-27 TaxID=2839985 RepID=UPI001C021396|nr:EAL domain-containing protein [Rhizobium sp. CSW-27]MBT9371610.1 EAL domain-containing protein [Rhizobium sp. CSW-27]